MILVSRVNRIEWQQVGERRQKAVKVKKSKDNGVGRQHSQRKVLLTKTVTK